MTKESEEMKSARFLADVIEQTHKEDRHKLKQLMLDVITIPICIFAGFESSKAAMAFLLSPYEPLLYYGLATGIVSILMGIKYYKTCIDEKNCKVCQER